LNVSSYFLLFKPDNQKNKCLECVTPNVIENLDLRPSQSPGIGRLNLAPISNSSDDSIAPIAGAFASVLNQIFNHVGYNGFCYFDF